MSRSERRLRYIVLIVGLSATLLVLLVWTLGGLRRLEGGLYDLRAQQFQHFTPPPTDRLVHIDIDDTTLDAVGAWPWPRTILAQLIDEMALAGTKVIGLDVLFSQGQTPQWLPAGTRTSGPATQPVGAGPDGKPVTLQLVDHDANLAASFRRAGNVLMAASLQFRPSRPSTPAMNRAVDLLRADPSLSPEALAEALSKSGASAAERDEALAMFFALRREAITDRIEADLIAAGSATLPATRPSTARRAGPGEDPKLLDLVDQLFPGQALPATSPQYRLVAEAYEKARGLAALDRFSRPLAPGVVAFKPRGELPPLPVLLESAAYSGFVDYPPLSDGTVRTVPMFVEHHGKLFPQMGLRLACAMLDLDPAAITIEQDAITLPSVAGIDGKSRPPLRVPLRVASRTFESGRRVDFPLLMDIPWFGTSQWETMYDPSQPNLKKQHLPLAAVYAAVSTKGKLERSVAGTDRAARDLITFLERTGFLDDPDAVRKQYADRPVTGMNHDADLQAIDALLNQAKDLVDVTPQGQPGPRASQNEKDLYAAVYALAEGKRQLPSLQNQLAQERQHLKEQLSGKAALIGWASTWTAADLYPTPLHDAAPGVVVHGVIVNALLTGDVWRAAPAWLNGLVALFLGALTTLVVARFAPAWALVAAVLIAVAYLAVNGYLLFDYGNYLLEVAVPLSAVATAWGGGTITRLVFEARERARITKRFSAWVDPDIVNYFLEVRDESLLNGQRCETSVVFTDLAGFTTLSEQLGEDVVPLLNDFMGRAVRVIKEHRGVVNKFLGDGILFFFNAPRPNATYITDAVESILGLQRMMVEFNADLTKQKLPQVKLRAGVTTGRVIAGDAGTAERGDYTVIGDLVNLAARLESANKAFGTSNLVTDATVAGTNGKFLFRPIGSITVVGQQTLVRVFETLGYADSATEDQKRLAAVTTKMVEGFAAGDARACLAGVEELESITGKTKLTATYRNVCEPYATGKAEGAMPAQITLSEK